MKKNCWMTWKRIMTVIKAKNINLHPYKILTHSGNPHNNTADLVEELQSLVAHLEISQFSTHCG